MYSNYPPETSPKPEMQADCLNLMTLNRYFPLGSLEKHLDDVFFGSLHFFPVDSRQILVGESQLLLAANELLN